MNWFLMFLIGNAACMFTIPIPMLCLKRTPVSFAIVAVLWVLAAVFIALALIAKLFQERF